MIEWNDGLSVGIEELDNDHKKILDIINKLSEAIDDNVDMLLLEEIFLSLEKYTVIHFNREESYIKQCSNKSLSEHKIQHDNFKSKIPELKQRLINSKEYIYAQEITIFLTDWLVNHIIEEDIPLISSFESCKIFDKKVEEISLLENLTRKTTQMFSFAKRVLLSALVPVLGMLFLGFIVLWNDFTKYDNIKSTSNITRMIFNVNELVHALQIERGLSGGYIASRENIFKNNLRQQREVADDVIDSFIHLLSITDKDKIDFVKSHIGIFEESILNLKSIRKKVDDKAISREETMKYYSSVIKNLLDVTSHMAYNNLDSRVSSYISALSLISQFKETLGLERAYIAVLIEKNDINKKEYIKFVELLGMQKTFLILFEKMASMKQIDNKNIVLNSLVSKQISVYEDKVMERNFEGLNAEIWFERMTSYMNEIKSLEDELLNEINTLIDENIENRVKNLYLLATYITTLLLITFLILYLLKRSTEGEIHIFTKAIMHLADGGRSLKLYFDNDKEDDMSRMYSAYETTRQVLLKGDVYTKLYQNQKEIELKNQQRENLKLEEMAFFDPLTQMCNRRKFEELSTLEINHAKRYDNNLSFLMLDIDKFKNINDTYGHAKGDEVLKHFSNICKSVATDADTVARMGGEEFVVMLPETDLQDAYAFAEGLRKKVFETSVYLEESKISYTVSIGISILNIKIDYNIDEVLQRADTALYKAKNSGRNTTIIYEHTHQA